MPCVLIVTGNQDAAFDLSDEIESCCYGIEVQLICSNTDPYDATLTGVDIIVTDGTTRTPETDSSRILAWFHQPEADANLYWRRIVPVIKLPRINGQSLPQEDVQKIAEQVIHEIFA